MAVADKIGECEQPFTHTHTQHLAAVRVICDNHKHPH